MASDSSLPLSLSLRLSVQELEAIKARVRDMEEEAEKLRQMQEEVEKQTSSTTGELPSLSPAADSRRSPASVPLSLEEKMEVDSRSIYVGNVSPLS